MERSIGGKLPLSSLAGTAPPRNADSTVALSPTFWDLAHFLLMAIESRPSSDEILGSSFVRRYRPSPPSQRLDKPRDSQQSRVNYLSGTHC